MIPAPTVTADAPLVIEERGPRWGERAWEVRFEGRTWPVGVIERPSLHNGGDGVAWVFTTWEPESLSSAQLRQIADLRDRVEAENP